MPSYLFEDTLKICLLVQGFQLTEEETMLLKAFRIGL